MNSFDKYLNLQKNKFIQIDEHPLFLKRSLELYSDRNNTSNFLSNSSLNNQSNILLLNKSTTNKSQNKFLLRMKLLREKKEKDLINIKQQYFETFNLNEKTEKSESDENGDVNVNGEIIGFVQGDDLTKNGEGYLKSSNDSDYISSINEMKNNKINK